MAWIDIPTKEKFQGNLSVGSDDKVYIWLCNEHIRIDLTVDETFALINALNVHIQTVISKESPDNA